MTTLGGGGLKREVYRTDAQGNNAVLVQTITVDEEGNETTEISINTTNAERKNLGTKRSSFNNTLKTQTETGKFCCISK